MTATKTKPRAQVYLVYGEDELKVSSKARDLIRRTIRPEEETLGLEVIHARSEIVAEALAFLKQCREAVQTVGFLGGRKVVWLRNANFLDQSVIGKSKDVRAHLKDLAHILQTGLPDGHALVITAPQVDEKSEFVQACESAGEVIGFKAGKPWQRDNPAIQFASHAFRKIGLTASEEVIGLFVEKVGTDSRQLQQEAEKLLIYLGETRTARREDIETVISPSRELFVWNLEDAAADRDLASSLRILRQLLFQKEEPIKLISCLESRFRSLLVLREALDRGWIRLTDRGMMKGTINPEQDDLMTQALSGDHRLKNPYFLGIRAHQADGFMGEELDQCRRWILETRRQLVSSTLPESWLMEMLIIRICRKKKRSMKQKDKP